MLELHPTSLGCDATPTHLQIHDPFHVIPVASMSADIQSTVSKELKTFQTPPSKPVAEVPAVDHAAPVSDRIPFPHPKPTVVVFLRHCGCPCKCHLSCKKSHPHTTQFTEPMILPGHYSRGEDVQELHPLLHAPPGDPVHRGLSLHQVRHRRVGRRGRR